MTGRYVTLQDWLAPPPRPEPERSFPSGSEELGWFE